MVLWVSIVAFLYMLQQIPWENYYYINQQWVIYNYSSGSFIFKKIYFHLYHDLSLFFA